MVNRYVKNIDSIDHTYLGQLITAGSYYLIQSYELVNWQNSTDLLSDISNSIAQMAKSDDGNNDIANINDQINFLKGIDNQKDSEGAILSRPKLCKSGNHYQELYTTLTSSSGALKSTKKDNSTNIGFFTVKRYDASDIEIVSSPWTSVVKTVFNFEASYDISLIGGEIFQKNAPSNPFYLWVQGAPQIALANGGQVSFIEGGLDLSFLSTGKIKEINGRVPKDLKYDDTYFSHRLELTMIHDAGLEHDILLGIFFFKPPGV